MDKKNMSVLLTEQQEDQKKRFEMSKGDKVPHNRKKIPLQIYFGVDDYERLRKYAYENHLKMAEVVRAWSLENLEKEGY